MLVLKEEFIKPTYFFELQPFCYSSEVMIPDDPLVINKKTLQCQLITWDFLIRRSVVRMKASAFPYQVHLLCSAELFIEMLE